MLDIRRIDLPGGDVMFVEATDARSVEPMRGAASGEAIAGERSLERSQLPGEAEHSKAIDLLRSQLRGIGAVVVDALSDLGPDELSVEAHVKFAGDISVIPFIASTKSDGGLKVTLTWTKEKHSKSSEA